MCANHLARHRPACRHARSITMSSSAKADDPVPTVLAIKPLTAKSNHGEYLIVRSGRMGTKIRRHSGAPRSGEPGIHEHRPSKTRTVGVYGLRARASGAPRNDGFFLMSALTRSS